MEALFWSPFISETAHRGQRWTISFPSGKRQRITNDLSNYEITLDITPDGRNAVTAESTQGSNIGLSAADISQLEQITSGESPMREAIETNGRTPGPGPQRDLDHECKRNGSRIVSKLDANQVCRAGTFIVARVLQEGLQHIVRLNGDGTRATNLAIGGYFLPYVFPGR